MVASVYKCVNGIITPHSIELLRNSDVHSYTTYDKDPLRLPSIKRNWGKQRTCCNAFQDWNNLET